jgi:hypothetical protein
VVRFMVFSKILNIWLTKAIGLKLPHSGESPDLNIGTLIVRYHCGGRPEEVNSCVLNSYMVYL